MINKKFLWLFILTTIIAVSGCTNGNSNNNNANQQNNNLNNNSNQPDQASSSFTMDEVKIHNSPTDCYTAINGSVYDLTGFISKHPGGPDKIELLCGLDGSSAFNNKHSGQMQPEKTLASLKIGTLK